MWTQPKVNWKSTDYFNIEDWQRIRANFEHLRNWMLDAGFGKTLFLGTELGLGCAEIPYIMLVNNMESNLASLREIFGVSFTEDVAQKTWYARLDAMYTGNPTFADWNRWETILLRVHESIQYIDTYVFTPISGTCSCGSERTLLRFSRGR